MNKENKIGYRKQLSSFLTNIDTRLSWLQKPNKYFPYMLGKESTFSGGDPGLIPGSGRSTGEGRDYPLQYSWASLVAQLVRNLPAMQEIWVQSLGWEDPLEKGMATVSSILAWGIPCTEESTGRLQSMGSQRVEHD